MRGVRLLMAAVAACLIGVLVMTAAVTGDASADTPSYAPLDQPGPPLAVPLAQLQASLYCQPGVRDASRTPVLLNPATGVNPDENYSWNWEPALTKLGIPWCAYTAPNDTTNEIATSGEYLVYAIRTMYAMAGRKIDILGHSQGGMSMRWALRFWPDTRPMVDDIVGFSGSNHGTQVLTSGICQVEGCAPASWEQLYDSPFIEALNSGAETFAGISYTEVWTHTDEVVTPNGNAATASAALHTGAGQITDVPTQQLCPGDLDEHLLIGTIDPVAYALAIDAFTHAGPADVARTQAANPGLCSELYQPGVNPADLGTYLQVLKAAPGLGSVAVGPLTPLATGAPDLFSAPSLPCYVYASCVGAQAPALSVTTTRRGRVLSATVRTLEGNARVPVPGVTVTLAGHSVTTGPLGRAGFTLKRAGRYTLSASRAGTDAAQMTVRAG